MSIEMIKIMFFIKMIEQNDIENDELKDILIKRSFIMKNKGEKGI